VAKSFTDVPPISMTNTFFGSWASLIKELARFCRAATSSRTIDVFISTLARLSLYIASIQSRQSNRAKIYRYSQGPRIQV
jgi:hypothetical protein